MPLVPRSYCSAIAPLLLTAVALTQIILTRTTLLSSWKGGGFGMFAALDGGQHRWIRVIVSAPDRTEELTVPGSLEELAARIQLYPAERWLDELARKIARREWRHGRSAEQVRVELWRTDYRPYTLEANTRRLASHTVTLGR
jgi:hypothetical protein